MSDTFSLDQLGRDRAAGESQDVSRRSTTGSSTSSGLSKTRQTAFGLGTLRHEGSNPALAHGPFDDTTDDDTGDEYISLDGSARGRSRLRRTRGPSLGGGDATPPLNSSYHSYNDSYQRVTKAQAALGNGVGLPAQGEHPRVAESGLSWQEGEVFANARPDPSLPPGWASDYLLRGLKRQVERKKVIVSGYGWLHVALVAVVFLLGATVLACGVLSKVSLLKLVYALRLPKSTAVPRTFEELREAHTAFVMLAIVLLLPNVLLLVSSVWTSCYRSRKSAPYPSLTAIGFIFLQCALEVTGLIIFLFVVGPDIRPALLILFMCSMFLAPAGVRIWGFECTRGSGDADNAEADNERVSLLHSGRASNGRGRRAAAPTGGNIQGGATAAATTTTATGLLIWLACAAQLTSLIYLPIFVFSVDDNIPLSILFSTSLVLLSICWLPSLHRRMVRPNNRRAACTARIKAGIISAVFRIGLTITGLYVVARQTKGRDPKHIYSALKFIARSELLVPFLVHIVTGFLGYQAARLACVMSVQTPSFAVPLALTTPLALVLAVIIPTKLPYHLNLPAFPTRHLLPILLIGLLGWLSQLVLTARVAWNRKLPQFARDETLFIQNSYNSVMLEQFALVNRLAPDERIEVDRVYSADEEAARSKIYVCTTMYRETRVEMRQLFRSLCNLDADLEQDIECHIFLDGAITDTGNPSPFALRLLRCIQKELKKRYEDGVPDDFVAKGVKIQMPYGLRTEWTLPNGTPLILHMKDPKKIKAKKRWSQVMYMFYFLQFRLPLDSAEARRPAYILTTDADVKFEAKDVRALLLLLARDKRVGAVCARTYPMGAGPMMWYQVFDYAVGHWFQKTAEHVLGTVLCSPGCFSLFRVDALRDTLLEYSTSVTKASEFLTKDMGEDRWLCTLLILKGWRLDYTAAAVDGTFCPTSFEVFFNQRRRWLPSTLANIVELLNNWGEAVRANDSVSHMFLAYQVMMLFSALIAPATVILVIIGGLSYSTSVSLNTTLWVLVVVSVGYGVVCLTTTQATQLKVAKLLTILFALVMGVVAVGVAAQIGEELSSAGRDNNVLLPGNGAGDDELEGTHLGFARRASTSTIYLFSIVLMFILAAAVHPKEAVALLHGTWYLLCLPGGYLFLIIYSFCNLDDRSWGTREEATRRKNARNSLFDTLLAGCGLKPKESLIHFFGRRLCCQPAPTDSADLEAAAPDHPYSALAALRRASDWQLSEDASKAECYPVTALLKQLEEHAALLEREDDLSDMSPYAAGADESRARLAVQMRTALRACPSLLDWGNWRRQWDRRRQTFRKPREGGFADPSMWLEIAEDIQSFVDSSYSWHEMVPLQPIELPDSVRPIQAWLHSLELRDSYLERIFVENGYTNTTFCVGLELEDLVGLGILHPLEGRANARKLLKGIAALPRDHLPDNVPANTAEWLQQIHLESYYLNFKRCGYDDINLVEYVTEQDLSSMGISKPGHVRKLKAAIARLAELLFQGRKPQDASESDLEQARTREMFLAMDEVPVHESILMPRYQLSDEELFWEQVLATKLSPEIEPLGNVVGLKESLARLRNMAVLVLFVANALWLTLMIELGQRQTNKIRVLNTNPLGFLFLIIYGTLFAVQFLCLVYHRAGTLVQVLTATPFPPRRQEVLVTV